MRNKLVYFVLLMCFSSCKTCDDGASVQIEFYNHSSASLITAMFIESKSFAGTKVSSSPYEEVYGSYCFDNINGTYLMGVDWRLADPYFMYRSFDFYSSNENNVMPMNFRDALSYFGTDKVTIPIATSVYNLWKWKETRNSLYLEDSLSLSINDLGADNCRYTIDYQPKQLGCCFKMFFDSSQKSYAAGIYFYSEVFAKQLGNKDSYILSIIGTRSNSNQLLFPLGFGNVESFGAFFEKCKTDSILFLIADSEENIIRWEAEKNDALLISKQIFKIEDLGAKNNLKEIHVKTL